MLNKEQQIAVDCKDPKIVCLAGAGTGKTFTMIERITSLVVNENIDPNSILVLTFTNAAALEMHNRYAVRNDKPKVAPKFSTFHAFCYSLLCTDAGVRGTLGYNQVPKIATEAEIAKIKTRVQVVMGYKPPKISNTMSTADKYKYDVFCKRVTQLMIKDNLISFDMMCNGVCTLFVSDNPSIRSYKSQYKYIFVDEFQDMDSVQFKFITSFADSNLFVVGDILQAIYGFRGADSSILKSLIDNNEWTVLRLCTNYRSTDKICMYANRHTNYLPSEYHIDLVATPQHTSDVDVVCTYDNVLNTKFISELGSFMGTTAVLVRTNREVDAIKDFLTDHNITFNAKCGDTLLSEIPHIVTDDKYCVSYLSAQFTSEQFSDLQRYQMLVGEITTLDDFMQVTSPNSEINQIAETVYIIRSILKNYTGDYIVASQDICKILHIPFVGVPSNFSNELEFLEQLIYVSTQASSANSQLYVGTIHSVKGLEYDNVLLLNVGGKSFKLSTEENQNLFYVGVTRAKSFLHIFWNR